MNDARLDGNGDIVASLLDLIPGLRQRSHLDRLKYFETICVMAIGEVGDQFPPAACLAALLRVAADGGVPKGEAIAIIRRTVRGCGLIFPELDALKQHEEGLAGAEIQDDFRAVDIPGGRGLPRGWIRSSVNGLAGQTQRPTSASCGFGKFSLMADPIEASSFSDELARTACFGFGR